MPNRTRRGADLPEDNPFAELAHRWPTDARTLAQCFHVCHCWTGLYSAIRFATHRQLLKSGSWLSGPVFERWQDRSWEMLEDEEVLEELRDCARAFLGIAVE